MPADPATASTDALKRSDLKVEYLAIDKLTPFARNARTHSEGQVEQIANSMREFGWTNPILIDPKGMIIAGHGRIMAAERLKIAQVPVIRLTGLSAAQKRALVLADNKLASNAGWDIDLLRLELGDLKADGFNLDITGFNAFEIADIFATKDGKTDPDATPPLEEKPVSKTGDTWMLGPHRLTCGDSTKPDDVAACLKGARPMLCVTDPPYGIEYDADWRNKAIRSNGTPSDGRAIGKVQNDDRIDWSPAFKLFAGDVLYCWHADRHASEVQQSLESATFQIRTQIIWAKTRFAIGRGHYHWQHEPCQPAGTMVQKIVRDGRWKEHTQIESVPIETLKAGDKVVSYANAKIYRRGQPITRIGSRHYVGNMHRVTASGHSTRATAEHQFTVRFDPKKAKVAVVYLMKRGDRWRVGVCGLFNSRGFGPAVRLSQESGESLWILSAHEDLMAARVQEQVLSCLYGIPTTHWETNRGASGPARSKEQIEQIYRQIGNDKIRDKSLWLLQERGLRLDYPLITSEDVGRFSRKQTRIVRACNLVPGIMQLPVPTKGEEFAWENIADASFGVFSGDVWSMDVERDQHYVADGIVTHNCWYAVRKGKTGRWVGGHKQTTLWTIEHQRSETGHSTQKPVECMQRPIKNHTKAGEFVYEPFSGSGTTIIAAEMTGRVCLAIEIAPNYVDLAVRRWEQFTGKTAKLESTGQTFIAVERARALAPKPKRAATPKAPKRKSA